MADTFDIDDLVWAKFLNYRPWPGRIIRETIGLKEGHLCVQFYGNDDHSQVLASHIYPYLDRVEEFTRNLPKNYNNGFYTAINTIHEKYWNLIDLKRNSEDTGFPIDTDEEIEVAIEDRKAGRWNPCVLRRPLPLKQDDGDNNSDSSEDDDDYPDSSWGNLKMKRRKKDKKGTVTKQKQTDTKTKNSTKKTRSKTVASSKTLTADQSAKASTSGQSCVATTSGQNRKISSPSQSKASTLCQSDKTLTTSPRSRTSCKGKGESSSSIAPSPGVSSLIAKRQLSVRLVRLSAQKIACQNTGPSTSEFKNTNIPEVNTLKRKSSETMCLSEKEIKPSTSKASDSSSFNKKVAAPQASSSPFQHLSQRVCPADKITVPRISCTECKTRFGFIGLKHLSQILIHSLLKQNHIVNVWSKDASKFNALTKAGAVRTNTPAGIITSSDVIFYSTKDPDISKNILLTREGVCDGCERSLGIPKIFVELTNIDIIEPERSIRPLIKYQGGYYLQMKAMIPQMKEDSPIFVCAGNERVFAALVPCLYHVTREIHYFGTEFFKDAPLKLTSKITEELVFQSLQKTSSYLYDLGFNISDFEKIICHENFDFQKVAAKLKEHNEAKRNEKIVFYQNM